MNVVILGPQGSGKGTQAEMLVKKYQFNYVEMGKILRSISNSDNPIAFQVKESMNKGEKVSDELAQKIAWDHLSKTKTEDDYLFDGYPRGLTQYIHLEEMLGQFGQKIDKVVYIQISDEEVVRRLSARRTCKICGNIYNLITNPPPSNDKCDCGGELLQREDDYPEAIIKRLEWGKTIDVRERARQEGILIEINGEQAIGDIHREIIEKLGL